MTKKIEGTSNIDDEARLPVVAWWLKNSNGEKDIVGLGSGEHVYQGVYDEKIFLCRLTDAQAMLNQAHDEIARLNPAPAPATADSDVREVK